MDVRRVRLGVAHCAGIAGLVLGAGCGPNIVEGAGTESEAESGGGSASSEGNETQEAGSASADSTSGPTDGSASADDSVTGDGDGDATADGGPGTISTSGDGDGDGDGTCVLDPPAPCDVDDDYASALGLNCPGSGWTALVATDGLDAQRVTLDAVGSAYAPTQGSRFIGVGSGEAAQLGVPGDCNVDVNPSDVGTTLPPPLQPINVVAPGCLGNPAIVGSGDCSNTLQSQWVTASNGAADYASVTLALTAPPDAGGFAVDVAFATSEYPAFWNGVFNDLAIVWLESTRWTGNIAYGDDLYPLTPETEFLTLLDADATAHPLCPTGSGCAAPELQDTCFDGNGATPWLTASAAIEPGESIQIVFAAMDLQDSIFDSWLFVDNFRWTCDGALPPVTTFVPK